MSDEPKPGQRRNAANENMKELSNLWFCAPGSFPNGIGEQLTKFRKHKGLLLSHLRDAYEGGQKTELFQEDKSWPEIERVAILQYASHQRKEAQPTGTADRRKKLGEIANALTLIESAMPSVGKELMEAWAETSEFHNEELYYAYRELDNVIAGLSILREAAVRAAAQIKVKSGRQRGSSVLEPLYVYWLAEIYRSYVGLKPGAGHGPFARFMKAYINAIGLGRIGDDTLIDLIKAVRVKARRKHSELTPSPFED